MRSILEKARSSIRTRMVLGLALMLVPLLALGAGSFYFSRTMLRASDRVVRAGLNELLPVTELQKLLMRASMPPNDYLVLGDPQEKELFLRLVQQVDLKFSSVIVSPHLRGEYPFLEDARTEWESAKKLGAEIFAVPLPAGRREAGLKMKEFDVRITRASDRLGMIYEALRSEIDEYVAQEQAIRTQETALMLVVILGAAAIAGVVGMAISRSVVRPLRVLQDGMLRFSEGDHSFRVALDRTDEFGQLARTMNLLAERLEFDTLTGVFNRREFQRKLQAEVDRATRYGRVFSLLMVDIDHFKSINDTHGHQAGDEVLRLFSLNLLREMRAADTLARYGGEEFVVLMPETAGPMAETVAERLRTRVAARPLTASKGVVLNVTVSIGIATFPDDAQRDDELIAAADKALYQAKEAGRNRTIRYQAAAGDAGTPGS